MVAESRIWLSDFSFHFLHNVCVLLWKARVFILKSLPLNLLSPSGAQALILDHLCPGVLGVRKTDQKHLEFPSLYHLPQNYKYGCMPSTEHFYPHCLSAFWWLLTSRECINFLLFLPCTAFLKSFGMATHNNGKPIKHCSALHLTPDKVCVPLPTEQPRTHFATCPKMKHCKRSWLPPLPQLNEAKQ